MKTKRTRRPLLKPERDAIRRDYKSGLSYKQLSEKYLRSPGVLARTLRDIKSRRGPGPTPVREPAHTKAAVPVTRRRGRRPRVAVNGHVNPIQDAIRSLAEQLDSKGIHLKGLSIDFDTQQYRATRLKVETVEGNLGAGA